MIFSFSVCSISVCLIISFTGTIDWLRLPYFLLISLEFEKLNSKSIVSFDGRVFILYFINFSTELRWNRFEIEWLRHGNAIIVLAIRWTANWFITFQSLIGYQFLAINLLIVAYLWRPRPAERLVNNINIVQHFDVWITFDESRPQCDKIPPRAQLIGSTVDWKSILEND